MLVGITAGARSRRSVLEFFSARGTYRTLVPRLPLRRGLRHAALWLERYLERTLLARYDAPLHVLAYIAGGGVLRCLAQSGRLPALGRVLYVRGPVQELVPGAIVRRYGRLFARMFGGRAMLDLAEDWPQALPFPRSEAEQGLLIEQGSSALARSLGLGPADVPPSGWDAERLLPGAQAVLRVHESHDEVYASAHVLGQAQEFFRSGRFAVGGA